MGVTCEIIKDLLPLYLDGVCSCDSRALVEAHLASCDNCRAESQAMQAALPIGSAGQNLKKAEALQHLSLKWRKGMFKSLLKGVFYTLITLAATFIVLYVFIGFKF